MKKTLFLLAATITASMASNNIYDYLTISKSTNSSINNKTIILDVDLRRNALENKKTHKEERNPYYKFRDEQIYIQKILKEFGLDSIHGHVVNGHVPVKVSKGENPVKANGQLIVIDGGMSKAYQKVTGIAGYTLIYNSYGLVLVAHQPFESKQKAVVSGQDIVSEAIILDKVKRRKRVADTDIGSELKQQIFDLKMLLAAYRMGIIKEIR